MENLRAENQIIVDQDPEQIFDFLCDPNTGAELTPLEERIADGYPMTSVGDSCLVTVEIAAREVTYTARCVAHDRPTELAMEMEGELEGQQKWRLTPAQEGTIVRLSVELIPPQWIPAYLRDESSARNWAMTLVRQTLDNLKKALDVQFG